MCSISGQRHQCKAGTSFVKNRNKNKNMNKTLVVVTGQFINFLLRKHFITEIFLKKKSGDVNDEANFSLFILLHKRA
jgi:hypothetical protein